MPKFLGKVLVLSSLFMMCAVPVLASAQTITCVNSYAGYQKKTYTLPANTQNPGPNQHNSLQTNAGAAKGDIGKTFFTIEMTSFNDRTCSWGPCVNNFPGIAHRTWPPNSCVAVCNSLNKKCAIAIVMDRGPNTRLGCRTIDANPALQVKLGMVGKTVPATYKLLSIPPEKCEQIPVDISAVAPSVQTSGYAGPSSDPFTSGSGYQSSPIPTQSSPSAYSQPSLTPQGGQAPITSNQPLPQSITSSNLLTAASPEGEIPSEDRPQSTVVSDLLKALAGPTTTSGALTVKSPLKLTESVDSKNASSLSGTLAATSSSGASNFSTAPPSVSTFSNSYQSPDLRWSTPNLFEPFFREVAAIMRSLIDLVNRL